MSRPRGKDRTASDGEFSCSAVQPWEKGHCFRLDHATGFTPNLSASVLACNLDDGQHGGWAVLRN